MQLLNGTSEVPQVQEAPVIKPAVQIAQLTEDDLTLLKEFKDAKELMKLAENLKKTAEAKIRDLLGEATTGVVNGKTVVRVNSGSNSHLDGSIIQDGWPEAYDAAKKTTDYTYVTVSVS